MLFCSDGLSGMVDDDRLAEVLGQGDDPQAVADALVQAALKGGGEDNITAVVVMAIAGEVPEGGGAAAAAAPRFGPERRDAEPGGPRGAAMSARRALGRLRGRVVVLVAGAAALLLVLVVAVALFNSSVYFVGTRDGRVALYNGLPYVLFGRELSHVVEVAPTRYAAVGRVREGARGRPRADHQGGGTALHPRSRPLHDHVAAGDHGWLHHHIDRRGGHLVPGAGEHVVHCGGERTRRPWGRPSRSPPRDRGEEAMSRSNRELLFLFPALLVTTVGFALVYMRESETLDWYSLSYGAAFLGLFGLVHVFRRLLVPRADPYLLPITALLSSLGILMIYRLDQRLALLQAEWLVVGLVVFVAILVLFRRYEVLADYRYLVGLLGILLLLFTIVAAREVNGARLWVRFGGIGFQPPEFAKVLLVVFFAAYLADVRELLAVSTRRVLGVAVPPFRYLAPLLAVWALSLALMIFLKDLGTSLLFFGALLALLYVATGRPLYVVTGLGLFAGGSVVLYQLFHHVQVRVDVWLNPWSDVAGRGYQIVQSLFALAAGGLFGRGLGEGYLLLRSGQPIIPALETDFIFSAIGEELGLAGAAAIVLLYFIFVYRGLRVAVDARDDFSRLLAAGLTALFGLQAFIILGGVTKLIPLTGITLPFVSYGGSSIVANFALLALLLLASDRGMQQEERLVKEAVERGAVVPAPGPRVAQGRG